MLRNPRIRPVSVGCLPVVKGFVRIQVLGNDCPRVYAMVGGSNGEFQQVTPRYFVEIEQTETELEVIFKLTPPTPVRFKMFDADTGEDLFSAAPGYPEVFVREGDKWWILALFDSSGQHNFAPVIRSMEGRTFRATAEGYRPKTFTVTGLKPEGIEHRVELQRVDNRHSNRVTVEANSLAIDSWKRFKVGDTAANMIGFAADGSYYNTMKTNAGRFMLVCYWSIKDENYEKAVETVERIFQRHGHRDDFHINSYWTDGEDEFLKEMDRRGRKFFSRRKWWPMAHLHRDPAADKTRISSHDIRPGRTPVFFVLDKKYRYQAVDVPIDEIERTIDVVFTDQ